MAPNDVFKRYLDEVVSFTSQAQERAEVLLKEMFRTGENAADSASEKVEDLLDRAESQVDQLGEIVRREVREQVTNLGVATKDDLEALRREIASLRTSASPASRPAPPSPAAQKAPAKKAAPPAAPVKKAPPRKAP